ncbi:phage tail protein [Sphingosinithalassobacter portus]|uniref:phage tail protein n=1 Tax=Stakelama portus TaxID=2676234 RepID=UPI000D6E5788|nr:phage tail protein [Sphingosinithalassobacter portus]
MATLVLTVAGTAIGGPLGGSIGAAIGGVIDREVLFKPAGREGPRLTELAVQTSSYGTQIPKLFGTMRVAGSVVWATDLVEHRSTSGGKGRPSTTNYSYTVSLAVALSGRPILSVRRIWADGKLLRGTAGDFKARTGFRLHRGDEDQAVDPLIAAAEGVGLAPAHRGIAYAVFEDLELAEYGNRIPSMTFEVIADPGAVAAGDIAACVADGALASEAGSVSLDGFSVQGGSVRAVAETLAGAANGWFVPGEAGVTLVHGIGETIELPDEGVRDAQGRMGTANRAIAAADSAARMVSLTHYDPARDYQAGVQRASRPGAGTREARLELPAAIAPGAARTIAQAALARIDRERERRTLTLGWHALTLFPGGRVTIAGTPGQWRIDRWSLEAMVLRLELLRIAAAPLPAGGGRVLSSPDLQIGDTVLAAFELPLLEDRLAVVPRLAAVAAGTGAGWRSAGLMLSIDDGAHWSEAGATAPPGVLGTIDVPPGVASAAIADAINHCEVTLANPAMQLSDADAAALDNGASLALAGEELLQFARAEPLGAGRWRLRGLWRGRRGTEHAIGGQNAGDAFVLIDSETVKTIDLASSAIGAQARVTAQGAGDGAGVTVAAPIDGRSVVPPSPVHPRVQMQSDGALLIEWVRRSRLGWRWIDGVDAALGEEMERYRVSIAPGDAPARTVETETASIMLDPVDFGAGCAITICQIGSQGLSRPLSIILSDTGEPE